MIPRTTLYFLFFPFFIFSHVFEIIIYPLPIVICFFIFGLGGLVFDLHTTFQRKELLKYEQNKIISYFLSKTTIKKTILIFTILEVGVIILIPVIFFLKIDLTLSGIIYIVIGIFHFTAGISNKKIIKEFDNNPCKFS